MYKLVTNKIRCKFCGDVIESRFVHDFVQCRCGKCSTDGGLEYAMRSFATENPEDTYVDLSTYLDTETGKLIEAKDAKIEDIPVKAAEKSVVDMTTDEVTEKIQKAVKEAPANPDAALPDIPKELIEEQSDEPERLPEEGKVTETDKKGKPVAGRYPYNRK